MIRVAVMLCFSLTLLCPVFCLAGEDDACSDHILASGRNCEAMSIGALAVESQAVEALATFALLWPDPLPLSVPPPISQDRFQLTVWKRAITKPPPAATRQALLQTFLN